MRLTILLCLGILFIGDAHTQDTAKLIPTVKTKGEYIILKDSTKLIGNVWRSGDGIKLDGKPYDFSQLLGYKENSQYNAIFNGGVYYVWALGKIQAYSQWEEYGTTEGYNPHGIGEGKWQKRKTYASMCYLKKDD